MAQKPIAAGSLFGGLFSPAQSAKAKAAYLRALEEAAREVASWDDAEAGLEAMCKECLKGKVN